MRSLFLSLLAALAGASFATSATPIRFPNDAPLRAVYFADRNEGWAAGDEGVIWHTIDGGANWERQANGVRASLRAISFLNPFTGYIVGRQELPHGGSAGVILETTNGGLTWSQLAPNTLPGLHAVKFFSDKLGIVAGDGSDQYGSGVFLTEDGGHTWKIVAGPRQPGWLTADFTDPKTGALAGTWSSLAILRDSVFGKSDIDTLGGRNILCLRIFGQHAMAVGQGGLILSSKDTAGAKWGYITPKQLSPETLSNCDFNGLSLLGEHAWVAGRPGSIVLHTADYGKTWKIQKTGQNVPLNAIHFIDPRLGWAVGELGTILATEDGGKTWKVQRRGGQRAAVMFIQATEKNLPLETIVQLGADEGYLTTAIRVTCADPVSAPLSRANDQQRFSDGMRLAGGAAGESLWQFPLAAHQTELEAKDMLGSWDRLHGQKAKETLLRQLVLAIRMWQPEAVMAGVYEWTEDCTREAVRLAGEETTFPEQIASLGLRPWQVKRVLRGDPLVPGNVRQIPSTRIDEPSVRFGDGYHELARPAMAILEIDPAATPTFIGVARFLMEGITLAPGGTARRDLPPLTDTDLVRIKQREKALERAENLQALAKPDSSGLAGPEKLMARLPDMLKSLPEDQGAAAAYALADSFAHSGQWPLARETFLTLVDKYPKSREAIDAYRWLARFSSSSEARRRFELGQFMTRVNIEVVPTSGQQPKGSQIQQSFDPKLMGTVEHAILSQDPAETRKGYEFTLEMEKKLAQFGPLYVYDPALQFCFQSARRNLGDPECARNWYSKFLAETSYVNNDPNARPDPWRELAMAELWLINRNGKPVRPLGSCRQTTTRPYLDGKLDDACWQNAKALPLKTSAGELGAEFTSKAFFAYDNDFLYIGVECKHPKGMQVPKVEKRERDMDLRAFDRVSILLDLDRNYQTYYHLEVDQRGALAEDCWGDKSWNPRWFVAVDSNETGWTAEFAIPRGELTGERIHAGKVWACNVVRVVPGKGIQAWSTPADISPRPEGMGLLMFTDK